MPSILRHIRDDIAYILPMGIFLALTQVGVSWPQFYPASYLCKTVLTAISLALLWQNFTPIKWNHWWLGILLGIVGTVQWVGMQLWLQNHFSHFRPSGHSFNPLEFFHDSAMQYAFITVRMIGAVLVVPVMEELFWRDFLWRQILAPNDFKLASVGEWAWGPFLIVAVVFCFVHGNWWPTAIVWGLMIGALLVYTKSLGACIIMHATTNLLLGLYVLHTHDWSFW